MPLLIPSLFIDAESSEDLLLCGSAKRVREYLEGHPTLGDHSVFLRVLPDSTISHGDLDALLVVCEDLRTGGWEPFNVYASDELLSGETTLDEVSQLKDDLNRLIITFSQVSQMMGH